MRRLASASPSAMRLASSCSSSGGEQRHLADLLEVHAHRVVGRERVGHGLGLVHLLLGDFLDLLELLELGQRVLVHRGQRIVAEHVDAQALEPVVELFRLLAREVHVLERRRGPCSRACPPFCPFHELVELFLRGLFRSPAFGSAGSVLRGLVRGAGRSLVLASACLASSAASSASAMALEFLAREVVNVLSVPSLPPYPLCSLSCFAKASRSASDDAAPAVAWVCRMLM